ncbi:hypothetical protein [Acinetobacter sp.]|uniref:hypothetical protein n=1 Tax=Acinetobacter sp. TaxID=472 RepID=UPI00388DEF8B
MKLKHLQEFTQINEASGGGFFTEARGYSDSGEFTDEFYDLFAQVTKMKKVMKNQKWIDYMKLTDFNMDTSCETPARDAIKAVVALEDALNQIDREFDHANGHSSDEDDSDEMSDDVFNDDADLDDTVPSKGK